MAFPVLVRLVTGLAWGRSAGILDPFRIVEPMPFNSAGVSPDDVDPDCHDLPIGSDKH